MDYELIIGMNGLYIMKFCFDGCFKFELLNPMINIFNIENLINSFQLEGMVFY